MIVIPLVDPKELHEKIERDRFKSNSVHDQTLTEVDRIFNERHPYHPAIEWGIPIEQWSHQYNPDRLPEDPDGDNDEDAPPPHFNEQTSVETEDEEEEE